MLPMDFNLKYKILRLKYYFILYAMWFVISDKFHVFIGQANPEYWM